MNSLPTKEPLNLTEGEAALLEYILKLEERIKFLEEITKPPEATIGNEHS